MGNLHTYVHTYMLKMNEKLSHPAFPKSYSISGLQNYETSLKILLHFPQLCYIRLGLEMFLFRNLVPF